MLTLLVTIIPLAKSLLGFVLEFTFQQPAWIIGYPAQPLLKCLLFFIPIGFAFLVLLLCLGLLLLLLFLSGLTPLADPPGLNESTMSDKDKARLLAPSSTARLIER